MSESQSARLKAINSARALRSAFSIPEVMEALGVSRQTVYDEINAGRLRSFRVASRRLVSANALDAYIRGRETAEALSAGE
jgi:excisionase family DNA binding protein